MNMDRVFRETAERQPNHPAIIGPRPDLALTYAELDAAIENTRKLLQRAGLDEGQCVGLHHASGIDYIVLTYAVWRQGGSIVPIPTELSENEKRQICREIALDIVLSSPADAVFALPCQRHPAVPVSSDLVLIPIASPRQHPESFQDVNSAFIRYTSGTTASAKGVVLSHETIYERIQAANEGLNIGPEDRVLWLLSMAYHFTVSIVSYLSFGATILLPENHLAESVLRMARDQRATIIYGSPTHYAWMASFPEPISLEELRLALSTTTALDRKTALAFSLRFGIPVTQALGLIELGLPCINLEYAAEHSSSVGRPLPGYSVRLEDVGLGACYQEVLISGRGFLDAYYHPWRPREEILENGWFRTGDVGEINEHGCLFLHGRAKDVISVLGMKFFPREVEEVLLTHPGVKDACVLAQSDDRLGDVPYARVVANETQDLTTLAGELRKLCRECLASYKVPAQILFVDHLPKTASGKTLHHVIRSDGHEGRRASPPEVPHATAPVRESEESA